VRKKLDYLAFRDNIIIKTLTKSEIKRGGGIKEQAVGQIVSFGRLDAKRGRKKESFPAKFFLTSFLTYSEKREPKEVHNYRQKRIGSSKTSERKSWTKQRSSETGRLRLTA